MTTDDDWISNYDPSNVNEGKTEVLNMSDRNIMPRYEGNVNETTKEAKNNET